ncbi:MULTISPECIES: hypothetical protein [Burkholderiaceae]|uniref:Uncharacterized protein n=2 Tax=Burkholderiaceae TaxID=119060 RepID=A0AAW3V2J1_9BURK|nr:MULTISPECIES: hypothetical protein [Burkholderiaceae]MBB4518647.1 hypothetical protein [Paraburkholderia fungorum]MBB6204132.1 hypothetical protein [Paraburkholderia fungorum]
MNRLLTDVEAYARVNAFGKANTVPVHMRPSDGASAFDWISAQLARKGMTEEVEFARRDGDVCGDGALDVLRCLEGAAVGRIIERTWTLVARVYRDAVMTEHLAHCAVRTPGPSDIRETLATRKKAIFQRASAYGLAYDGRELLRYFARMPLRLLVLLDESAATSSKH